MGQDRLGEENRLEEEQSEHLWFRQIQDHDCQEATVENYSWQTCRIGLIWSLLFQSTVAIYAIYGDFSFSSSVSYGGRSVIKLVIGKHSVEQRDWTICFAIAFLLWSA